MPACVGKRDTHRRMRYRDKDREMFYSQQCERLNLKDHLQKTRVRTLHYSFLFDKRADVIR